MLSILFTDIAQFVSPSFTSRVTIKLTSDVAYAFSCIRHIMRSVEVSSTFTLAWSADVNVRVVLQKSVKSAKSIYAQKQSWYHLLWLMSVCIDTRICTWIHRTHQILQIYRTTMRQLL